MPLLDRSSGVVQAMPVWPLVVVLVLGPAVVRADEARPSGVEETEGGTSEASAGRGVLTRPPELIHFEEAPYPEAARAAGVTGTVTLSLVIDETGAVTEVEVVQSAGHGFDEAAVAAARRFRFRPAEVDGKPAPVRITYDYGFVLEALAPAARPERAPILSLRGRVLVRGRRDPVAGAIVRSGEAHTRTDAEGRFELYDLPEGEQPVRVLAPGFAPFETSETIARGQVVEVVYYLLEERLGAYHTVVRATRPRKEVTRRTLVLEEVQRIPGTRGDALRVVQTLPGVARTPYGLGPLMIRGSDPYDSRSFIDGHWIPLPFHFGGLTSVFNGDLISRIDLVPGNVSARYGRALAGVLTIETRPGDGRGLHGYADVDLYDAGVLLEGPIGAPTREDHEARTTFAVAARRSYVDAVLGTVLRAAGVQGVRVLPFYWDYQARLDHRLGPDDRLSLTLYGSHDALTVTSDDPEALGPELRDRLESTIDFHRLVAGWSHRAGPRLRGKTSLAVGWDGTGNVFGSDLFFRAAGLFLSARSDWAYEASRRLTLEGGLDLLAQLFSASAQGPPVAPPGQVLDPLVRDRLILVTERFRNLQPAAWAEATWRPLPPLEVVAGLRADAEPTAPSRHFSLDPRLSLRLRLREGLVAKGGAAIVHQPPNPFGTFGGFGNPALGWEGARHYALGVEWRVLPNLQLSLEGFYQDRFDRMVQTTATVVRDGERVPLNFSNEGRGLAYGLELYLKVVDLPGITAWLSYTFSRAFAHYAAGGPMDPFYNDQPHNLVVVGSFDLGRGWALGGALRWVSGVRETPIAGALYDADADLYVPIPGEIGSGERLPPFFSLDLRVDRRVTFRTWRLDLYLDVTNVTNRHNVESVTYNFDYTERRPLPGLPIFPSLGIKGEL